MKDFIALVVKHLVDKPEEVVVEEVDGHHVCVYELRVARCDMGKVIGRGGQTATALRVIITAASAKAGKRAVLEIVE